MKKAQLVIMGCCSLLSLLVLVQVGFAQPQCVAVTLHEVETRIVTALQALPPKQAKQAVTVFTQLTADEQQEVVEFLRRVLQLLPPNLHQAFIDGFFHVSPRKAQFAAEVLARVKALTRGAELPATCSSGPVM